MLSNRTSDIEKITLTSSSNSFWKQEQRKAIQSLEKQSEFTSSKIKNKPYRIYLSLESNKLVLTLKDRNEEDEQFLVLSLSPYKRIIKDYFMIIESYEAFRLSGNLSKLETIDMARRGIHDEGAERLQEQIAGKITMDYETARCFFTLICALYDHKIKRRIG